MPHHTEQQVQEAKRASPLRRADDRSAAPVRSLERYPELGRRDPADGPANRDGQDRASSVPGLFGRYRVVRELGNGGLGFVYLAEDRRLQRRVALRLLSQKKSLSPAQRRRLRRAMGAASRLDHRGICNLYAAGELDRAPYFAMRYVDGETLAARLAREREEELSSPSGSAAFREWHRLTVALAFFEKLADALHFAHERGLVHGDVKPGNIMIDERGRPVVLALGLAYAAENGDLTPYLAPEQLTRGGDGVDARTDVYALAVTLYETLALRRPFEADSRESLRRQILHDTPVSLRQHGVQVPRDLEIVLAKALEKEPSQRFATAADFASELRHLRYHEHIHTRPPGFVRRLRHWMQHNGTP